MLATHRYLLAKSTGNWSGGCFLHWVWTSNFLYWAWVLTILPGRSACNSAPEAGAVLEKDGSQPSRARCWHLVSLSVAGTCG